MKLCTIVPMRVPFTVFTVSPAVWTKIIKFCERVEQVNSASALIQAQVQEELNETPD